MAETPTNDTTPADLERHLHTLAEARPAWAALSPVARGRCLRAVAEQLDGAGEELIALAVTETHLGTDRLSGELRRTTFQLRLFADLLDEGSYLRATIDRPDPSWPPGPRPDLRRMVAPIGVVVVFAASNFPFAFSVAGGDTASALAAGCPVVLKAHPGHPVLSARTGALVLEALRSSGAPHDVFTVVYGDEAGRAAVVSEHVRAAAFTGSLSAGRALFDLASSRPDPIPFYGEMGSLNPVFVTSSAMAERRAEILSGFATSFTLSAGQFCTKPGLLFLPADSVTDEEIVDAVAPHVNGAALLNDHVRHGYQKQLDALQRHGGVRTIVADVGDAGAPTPTVLATTVTQLLAAADELLVECFGPATLVVTYDGDTELLAAAEALGGQLTAAVHGQESDTVLPALFALLTDRAGRVLWNGWPTGVSVTAAMQHGGPYPATTAPLHTSVGSASIERFLRPVSYQSVPDHLLPPALRDGNPLGVPRLVDGHSDEP
jgi:NADP-dependent aldehyde dehydrogenase